MNDEYQCKVCGYVYVPERGDPEGNILRGMQWNDIPDNWACPICNSSKELFVQNHSVKEWVIEN